nr:ATP-binding protein [Tissierella sp.]
MKQLLILSGKGGTGKTTIASAFIKLADAKAFADCDVDAPNLHLLMNRSIELELTDFYGMDKAYIDQESCISCGVCKKHCNFDAINYDEKEDKYLIDEYACEGCGLCKYICPSDAIAMNSSIVGDLMLYKDASTFSTAKLRMGSGNSGLLVTEVKKRMALKDSKADLVIIDGSPGIGCPVIASITGVDMVLVVAEPSVSGISDLERVVATADHFNTPVAVCVNKWDINPKNTQAIEDFCKDLKLAFVGKIPFDSEAVRAINKGLTIVDIECESGKNTRVVYENTIKILNDK